MRVLFSDWKDILRPEFKKDYYKLLMEFLRKEYETKTIYPQKENIFAALNFTPYENKSSHFDKILISVPIRHMV